MQVFRPEEKRVVVDRGRFCRRMHLRLRGWGRCRRTATLCRRIRRPKKRPDLQSCGDVGTRVRTSVRTEIAEATRSVPTDRPAPEAVDCAANRPPQTTSTSKRFTFNEKFKFEEIIWLSLRADSPFVVPTGRASAKFFSKKKKIRPDVFFTFRNI